MRWAVLFCVLGHHLKAEDGSSIGVREGSQETSVIVFCDHPDFRSCLELARNSLGLPADIPSLPRTEIDLLSPHPLGELRSWMGEASQWYENANAETRRFVAISKALLLQPMWRGSAVPRLAIDPGQLDRAHTEKGLLAGGFKRHRHEAPRGNPPRHFQKQVSTVRPQ